MRSSLLFFFLLAAAHAQTNSSSTITCNSSVPVPGVARAEGHAEPAGDIVLTCYGGTVLVANTVIPQADITLYFNTQVTSRLLPAGNASGISEALLTIDEPGSSVSFPVANFGPLATQNLCTTPLTGCVEYAGIIAGIPVATDTPGGTTQGKNVFQGVVGSNAVTFHGVPLLPPGASGTRTFRITNLRADASVFSGMLPAAFTPSIVISGNVNLLLSNPNPNLASIESGLAASASDAASLSQCTSQTRTALSTLSFTEGFKTVFKTRVSAQSNALYAGQTPVQQNVPGQLYDSESGLTLDTASGGMAGLTDFGTRLTARFNNIPAGARLYVSAANVLDSATPVTPPAVIGGSTANAGTTPYALLVTGESVSDGNAAGAFPAAAAIALAPGISGGVPVTEVQLVDGAGAAVWEVVNTNPANVETLKFAVYVTYTSDVVGNSPLPGTSTVNLSFAPTTVKFGLTGADAGVPRFIFDSLPARPILNIGSCALTPAISSLSPASAYAGDADTNVTISGTNFTSTSVAQWNASALQTTYISATRLIALVPAALLSTVGAVSVTVYQPGVGTSSAAAFTAVLPQPTASINGLEGGFWQGRKGMTFWFSGANPNTEILKTTLTVSLSAGLTPSAYQDRWICGGSTCTINLFLGAGAYTYSSPYIDVAANAPSSVTIQLAVTANGFAATNASATVPVTQIPAGSLVCVTNVLVAPALRGEGKSEQLGDLTLTCTGGTPPAANAQIPTTDLTVTLTTPITSHLLPIAGLPGLSEVLLLIDEPGVVGVSFDTSVSPPGNSYCAGAPLTVCPTPAQGCTEYASLVTPAAGPEAGQQILVATNSPTPAGQVPVAGFNIFQGVVSGNSVTFHGVPVLPPSASGMTRTFRIANLRADATAIANPVIGNPLTASVSTNGGVPIVFPLPARALGYVSPSLTTTATAGNGIAQCSAGTKSAAGILSFSETFGTAFKTRVSPLTNTSYAGQSTGSNQNVPGTIYVSESNLVLGGMAGGQTSGLADFGTRLKAQFSNVPAGIRLFVSVSNVTNAGLPVTPPAVIGGWWSYAYSSSTYYAQLVPGETAPFSPVSATDTAPGNSGAVPVAEIPVLNGSAVAVWEVVNTNPNLNENLNFAVYATYPTNIAGGTAKVNLSFGPTGSTTAIPRFAATTQLLDLFTAAGCAPAAPALSTPALATTSAPLAPALTWSAVNLATSYDVYFGTSSTPPLVGSTTATSFGAGSLSAGTTYYWRVVAKSDAGAATSPTWWFTTVSPTVRRIVVSDPQAFIFERGGATPPAQTLSVQSEGVASIALSAPAGKWLIASLNRTTTPASLTLAVNPAGLANGAYSDVVTVSAPGADDVSVRVNLTVRDQPRLNLSRSALSFEFTIGGATPAAQSISVAATGRNLDVTARSSAGWLSATPASLHTQAMLTVTANPAGLVAGAYREFITLTSPDATNSPLKIPVDLVVTAAAVPTVAPSFDALGVWNAASFRPGPLAPGSLFTISGMNLAAVTLPAATLPLPFSLGGTSVTVNGIAVPLLYVSPTQINAQAPFEIPPGTASAVVTAGGVTSPAVSIQIAPAAAGLFQSAGGHAAVSNQDSSPNSAANPCAVGTAIAAYLTGQGQVDRTPPTGAPAPSDSLSRTVLTVTATVGGLPAEVLFSGLAPGFVGVSQVNLKVPSLPPGDYPVVFTIGDVASNSALLSVR